MSGVPQQRVHASMFGSPPINLGCSDAIHPERRDAKA